MRPGYANKVIRVSSRQVLATRSVTVLEVRARRDMGHDGLVLNELLSTGGSPAVNVEEQNRLVEGSMWWKGWTWKDWKRGIRP